MAKWYKTMFEDKLAKFWLRLSDLRKEQTEQQIAFLKETLMKTGLTLDHCCGPGRLSIALAENRAVVGLDLSRAFLKEANKRAKKSRTRRLDSVRGDMRHLPFVSNVFNNVINVWTSFGYFSEQENESVLNEIVRVMKAKATFVMDIGNPENILRRFQERDWLETDESFTLEQRGWDWGTRRMHSRWIYIDKASHQMVETSFDHRLYSRSELQRMFEMHGLKIKDVYGSFAKEKFDAAGSMRIIIVARK